jgi:hypothetical protein
MNSIQHVVWRFVVNQGEVDRIEELGNVLVDVMDRFGSEALSTLSYRSYSDVFCLFIISQMRTPLLSYPVRVLSRIP